MLEPDVARARILRRLQRISPLEPERVALADALDRVLAEPLPADRQLPPFDNSQMDGYALRAADVTSPGTELPVALEIFAGDMHERVLPPGACARIFTGAPLPAGADSIEMQEEVVRRGKRARFQRPAVRGRFVRPAGGDIPLGALALARGTALDPGAIGIAAAMGRSELLVHRRPRVAILATGDEIVSIDREPRLGEIADTNSHALAAACRAAGALPTLLPIARDSMKSLAAAVAAARRFDALVTIGGVSVGERDLVRDALTRAGARLDFWRVAMRPGRPFLFGGLGDTALFGLPGNPASALVTFELFVRPALRALAGHSETDRLRAPARLSTAFKKVPGLTYYLRARAEVRGGEIWLTPLATQESGHLRSTTGFEALAILPKAAAAIPAKARIWGLFLRSPIQPQ